MNGTFRMGDVLVAEAIVPGQVLPGDVLVFSPSGASEVIVHRVVGRVAQGFITQGDAMRFPDATPVAARHVVGRVIQVQRGSRVVPVRGGQFGRFWAGCLRLWRYLLAVGRLPYNLLRTSGFIRRFWQPVVTQVSVETNHGPTVKYLCAGKTVAIWRPGDRSYWCRKPYDLVLRPPCWAETM